MVLAVSQGDLGKPAPDEIREFCRALVDRMGQGPAAKKLGIGRGTLSSVVAGFPVNPGTVALLQQARAKDEPPDQGPEDECA